MSRPGDRFRALARRFCDQPTMERVIDPAVADLQREYADACAAGRRYQASWIQLTGYWALLKALALCELSSGAVTRPLVVMCAALVVVTGLLMVPPLRVIGSSLHRDGHAAPGAGRLLVYLLPQALALSLPAALTVTVLIGWRDPAARMRSRGLILSIALACTVAGLVNLAWVLPEANQRFRILTAGRPVMPGVNELTIGDLWRRMIVERRDQEAARSRLAPGSPPFGWPFAFWFNQRLAFGVAPLVLGWSLITVATTRRRPLRWLLIAVVLAAFVGGYDFFHPGQFKSLLLWLPASIVAWLPNAFTVTATFVASGLRMWADEPPAG